MIKVGFIGNGSMSSTLVEKFLFSGKVSSSEIIVSNRLKRQPGSVRIDWSGINDANDNTDVVKAAKYVFLCADPSETGTVLEEIKDCVSDDTNIISTAFPFSINCLESVVNCKVSKLAPTMMSENGKQISVICHNEKVEEDEAEYIESLLKETCNAKVYTAKGF